LVQINQKKKGASILQNELKFITDTFKLSYLDTYPFFEKLPQDTLDSYFIRNDGHWNQKGCDYFSVKVSEYLVDFLKRQGE
jgi:hypothetical protein